MKTMRIMKTRRGFLGPAGGLTILFLAAVSLAQAATASAQCSDPAKHFRSGIWKQWIFWTLPGPAAAAAVQRVVAEVNQARGAAAVPLLGFTPQEPLIVGVIEGNKPRGPDRGNLADRPPNQETFPAT